MHIFLFQKLNQAKLDEINKYLRSRKLPIFTKKQISQMHSKNDELGILGLDIVIRGNWMDFNKDSQYERVEIKHFYSDDKVDESNVKHIIALTSGMEGFKGLCLDVNKTPVAIMDCVHEF